jgi:hypothetical protein
MVWSVALLEIQTLKIGKWLDQTIINFYLLHHWLHNRDDALFYLVNLELTLTSSNMPNQMQLDSYESYAGRRRPFPPRPVIAVIGHSHHFFVAIFDYSAMMAYVLGSRISHSGYYHIDVPWNDWNGPRLWNFLAALHGWQAGDVNEVEVVARQWRQVCLALKIRLIFLYTSLCRTDWIVDR